MMREQQTFGDTIRGVYLRSRKPLAFMLLMVALGAGALGYTSTAIGSVSAALLVILTVLFDLHDRLLRQLPQERFDRFHDAAIDFREKLDKTIAKSEAVRIVWLGMGMDYGEPLLFDIISDLKEIQTQAEIELSIAMLDPTWAEIEKLNSSWPQKAASALASFEALAQRTEDGFANHKVTLRLFLYRHVPNWHGFVLNKKHYYIGTCCWKNGRLVGGENPYDYITPGKRDEGDLKVRSFEGWLAFCCRREFVPEGRESDQLRKPAPTGT